MLRALVGLLSLGAACAQTIGNCPVFPNNNVWNTPVDNLPVHAKSAAYVNSIGPTSSAHADFGAGLWAGGPIGIPFITVPGSQPKVAVTFQYADESDPGPYPVPANAPIEGGSSSTGDRHVLVIDQNNCVLYELYAAYPQPDGSWTAGSGAIFDLKANNLRPATWTSADAAGLPILPGLARYDEVAAGVIRHALRFTAPRTQKAFVWPARHYASSITDTNYPPMGQRFRLKASYDISGFSPDTQIILQALKKYGMILADNGSAWYVSGAPDDRWNNDHLHEFGRLQGTDFEAVDESSLMVDPNSAAVGAPAPLGFFPVTPCRVFDTRSYGGKTGAFGPPYLPSGGSRDIPIPSSTCGIPATAQAYSLNVTAWPSGPLGFLSIWPAGLPQPVVSTLNSFDGAVIANAAMVPAGVNGSISVYASDATDVFMDINGYFAAPNGQELAFYPVTPCRVADTRSYGGKTGAFGPPQMHAGETRTFPVPAATCGIPTTAQAYSLNMTAWPPGTLQYLTAWPAGQPQPFVSTLNAYNGGLVANAAIVPAGTNGAINVFVTDPTDVFFDINGYFAPPGASGALHFYPITPCRVADTRSYGGKTGAFGPPQMSGGSTRSFPVPSAGCGIPASAQAYSLNITAWPPAGLTFLSTWPMGQPQPVVSTLNSLGGKVVANAAIVPAGANGAINVFVSDTSDLFIDINGYFAP